MLLGLAVVGVAPTRWPEPGHCGYSLGPRSPLVPARAMLVLEGILR